MTSMLPFYQVTILFSFGHLFKSQFSSITITQTIIHTHLMDYNKLRNKDLISFFYMTSMLPFYQVTILFSFGHLFKSQFSSITITQTIIHAHLMDLFDSDHFH